jgi:hypothetical protein
MPFVAHSVTEELEALSQINNVCFLNRQFQTHGLMQVLRQLCLFVFGLLAGA